MKRPLRLLHLVPCAAAILLGATLWAGLQDVKATATLKLETPQARPSAEVKGTVSIVIPKGWHGYQNPPTKDYQIPITIEADGKGTTLLKASYPKGVMEEFAGEMTAVYNGTLKVPVTFRAPAKEGRHTLKVKVGYQLCDAGSCLPPTSTTAQAVLQVSKKAPKPKGGR